MLSIDELVLELEKLAPLDISKAYIDGGGYDNSGLLIRSNSQVKGALFSLDLSMDAVKKAKRLKCNTIITHHPAIYSPLKFLSEKDLYTAPVLECIKQDINVISFHINLDMAKGGIDECLSNGLGGANAEILSIVKDGFGYGRKAKIEPKTFSQIISEVKRKFETNKIIYYGKLSEKINSVASFCGAGASEIEAQLNSKNLDVDLIVSSDMPHHVIKGLVESGYKVLILTHYVAEDYGFKKFYQSATKLIEDRAQTYYFSDKRFK